MWTNVTAAPVEKVKTISILMYFSNYYNESLNNAHNFINFSEDHKHRIVLILTFHLLHKF